MSCLSAQLQAVGRQSRNIAPIAGLLLSASLAFSQPAAPRYETVSIKPSPPGTAFSASPSPGGRFTAHGMPAGLIIQMAFQIQGADIIGMPDWVKQELFDIEAVPERPLTHDEIPLAMRTVLDDRFRLATHFVSQETSGYELSVARSGPKLKAAPPRAEGERSGLVVSGTESVVAVNARDVPLSDFIRTLTQALGLPVVDKTGLRDRYDFTIEWARHELLPSPAVVSPSVTDSAPSIFSAVEEKLGLKLGTAKIVRSRLVIDHIEEPSPN